MILQPSDRCRFVLVGTTHSGNLGATARAMKTMAIDGLDLVAPMCEVDAQAHAMAANAEDILHAAEHYADLKTALANCTLALGLTARPRRDGVPALTPREAASMLMQHAGQSAVLLGRERTGLTNEELACCQRLVHIPANPNYPALNIASAVQIMAYEIFLAAKPELSTTIRPASTEALADQPATGAHLEGLHAQFEAMVTASGYSASQPREVLMRRLRNFVNRARPSVEEVNLLRGVIKRLLP